MVRLGEDELAEAVHGEIDSSRTYPMTQAVDFDEESDEDVIERAVEKGVADLVEEITFQKIFALEDTQGF